MADILKSLIIITNRMGRHLWHQRPGLVADWKYPAALMHASSSLLASMLDWGKTYMNLRILNYIQRSCMYPRRLYYWINYSART